MRFSNGSHERHSFLDDEPPHHHHHHAPKRGMTRHVDWAARTIRIELFIVLLGCALLLAATSAFLGFNNQTTSSEMDKVLASQYQAVFLNGGTANGNDSFTTYFGHIKSINDKYYVLEDIFYLTAGQGKTAGQQLTKLGCDQLHAPFDRMIINRGQVAFWENLQSNGQVAKAIDTYKQKFPTGPKCTTAQASPSNTKTQSTTTPSTSPATTQTTPGTTTPTP